MRFYEISYLINSYTGVWNGGGGNGHMVPKCSMTSDLVTILSVHCAQNERFITTGAYSGQLL